MAIAYQLKRILSARRIDERHPDVSSRPSRAGALLLIRDAPGRRDVVVTCGNACLVVSTATYTPD